MALTRAKDKRPPFQRKRFHRRQHSNSNTNLFGSIRTFQEIFKQNWLIESDSCYWYLYYRYINLFLIRSIILFHMLVADRISQRTLEPWNTICIRSTILTSRRYTTSGIVTCRQWRPVGWHFRYPPDGNSRWISIRKVWEKKHRLCT